MRLYSKQLGENIKYFEKKRAQEDHCERCKKLKAPTAADHIGSNQSEFCRCSEPEPTIVNTIR